MRDFTLRQYKKYLTAIADSGLPFIRFNQVMAMQVLPAKFCLLRHDVDRKPLNALAMAQLENDMGACATYYFRAKPGVFNADIIKKISAMGHEVGYHYESLSDADGDIDKAVADFEKNLEAFRKVAPVKTISMHGRPLKPYDNRDIWRNPKNHELLVSKFNVLGEVYLDIDYTDIAYINDTGRNWTSGKNNRRDKVFSNVETDFNSGNALLAYLNNKPHPRMVFQIHPERWSDNFVEYYMQWCKDTGINLLKKILS